MKEVKLMNFHAKTKASTTVYVAQNQIRHDI